MVYNCFVNENNNMKNIKDTNKMFTETYSVSSTHNIIDITLYSGDKTHDVYGYNDDDSPNVFDW